MSYISLYRKYRPRTFHQVIGQDFITISLKNSIKQNKVGHAYIFAGPKGIGKTTIARVFAKALNCLTPIDGDACNKCENCNAIDSSSTDIVELDAASNNGVEDVRNIIDGVTSLPTMLKKRVYIIDEAHMLTTAAWNAMLKTIEDAPEHVVFIFATTEMHKIPSTILSRCQNYQFNRLTIEQLFGMIIDIANKENIQIEKAAITKIVDLADGSGRDVLSVLEQMAMFTDNNIKVADINNVFGLLNDNNEIHLINLICAQNTKEVFALLDEYSLKGINFTNLANDIVLLLIDKLVYLQTKDETLLKRLNQSNINRLDLNVSTCIALITIWQEAHMKIRAANDARSYFESAVFNSFKLFTTIDTVAIETIKATEIKVVKESLIEDAFSTKEIIFEKPVPKVEPKKIDIKEVMPQQNDEELFFQIAYNTTKKTLECANKFLEQVQSSSEKSLQPLSVAAKIRCASANGMVVLFEDETDAEIFMHSTSPAFLNEVKKIFGQYVYILGYDKEALDKLTQKFLILKKQGSTFQEPDLEPLSIKADTQKSLNQDLRSIFGDE